jgi:DNA-binding transcriptional LysR family regulator
VRDGPDTDLAAGVELRQLRYFVTLAEELHFGRAAEPEHIVQSSLSRQVQRLEREPGVRLPERSTHHVSMTAAGAVFLVEARQTLAQADRAAGAARSGGRGCHVAGRDHRLQLRLDAARESPAIASATSSCSR